MSQSDAFELMNFLMLLFIRLNEILVLHLHLDSLLIIILNHVVVYEIVVCFTCKNICLIFIVIESFFK